MNVLVIAYLEKWCSTTVPFGTWNEGDPIPTLQDSRDALKIALKLEKSYRLNHVMIDADGCFNIYCESTCGRKLMFLIDDGGWACSVQFSNGREKVFGDFKI